jgi:hypothetical protein
MGTSISKVFTTNPYNASPWQEFRKALSFGNIEEKIKTALKEKK